MKKDTKLILEDFENCKNLYNDFTVKCKSLIIDLLGVEEIKFHQITNRIKEKNKLEGKIFKKNHKYSKLSEITDIAGIRIITYFEDEVDRIAQIIESEFEVDYENSIDKRQMENDKFGYRSLHFVISLNRNRLKLLEYKKFKKLKVEIQIRTILQHSWAEIEHDIGYKGEKSIPQFAKRTFYRVAALLETADLEFVKLKNLLAEYETKVAYEIIETPETVSIDKTSLISFINSNIKIAELDKQFSEYLNVDLFDPERVVDELLNDLFSVNLKTIKELDEIISNNSKELFESFKNEIIFDKEEITGLSKGNALFQIKHLLKK